MILCRTLEYYIKAIDDMAPIMHLAKKVFNLIKRGAFFAFDCNKMWTFNIVVKNVSVR